MSQQNLSNHRRFHPPYHFFMLPLISFGLVGASYHLYQSYPVNYYINLLIFITFVILVVMAGLVRTYALKAQDRAIRAEETLRYYILTGKPLDARLRMGQIIALRFASDNELAELASLAANENLNSAEIKKAIKDWRADHYRV